MNPLPALICDYLDGADGAHEVLNDALEELGRSRAVQSGSALSRLQTVLNNLLPDRLAQQIALDLAEHASDECDSNQARKLLGEKRRWLQARPKDGVSIYVETRRSFSQLGWEDDNSSKSSAIWAIWSALIAAPGYVATAAQRVRSDELAWQIEHVKQVVMEQL